MHVAEPTDQQMTVSRWAAERADGQHVNLEPDVVRDPVDRDPVDSHAPRAAPRHDLRRHVRTMGHTQPPASVDSTGTNPTTKLITRSPTRSPRSTTAPPTGPTRTPNAPAPPKSCSATPGVPKSDGEPVGVLRRSPTCSSSAACHATDIAWVHDIADPTGASRSGTRSAPATSASCIGSTAQMGVGVNIQTRLYAAHELTAPYRPDWLEQAEGRMVRQGNHHHAVELHRYVTERTADASALADPATQSALHRPRDVGPRADDPQPARRVRVPPAEEFAQISAIATGDQRHIELAAVTAAVDRLERAERAHAASRDTQRRSITHATNRIAILEAQIEAFNKLTPTDADPADIGQQVIGIGRTDTTVTLAGVTYATRRGYEGLRLEIADTGVSIYIDRERLTPADAGRGLGKTILNEHRRISGHVTERQRQILDQQRQIDAEHARPVTEVFTRHAELDTARARKAQLTEALQPRHARTVNDTGAPPEDTATVADAADPVFGTRTPTPAERHEWAGAYSRFNTMTVPNWGNRAKGADNWINAVNTFSTDPTNAGTKAHLIGQYMGVMLTAQCNGATVSIAPQRHHGRFNTLTVDTGTLTKRPLEDWLHSQHQRSITEKTSLRTTAARPHRPDPNRNRGVER